MRAVRAVGERLTGWKAMKRACMVKVKGTHSKSPMESMYLKWERKREKDIRY